MLIEYYASLHNIKTYKLYSIDFCTVWFKNVISKLNVVEK